MTTDNEFDYIVTGAGSAGCVLANRLSGSGQHKVLLLEAGGKDSSFWIHVPMGYAKTFVDPRVNWMFDCTEVTVPMYVKSASLNTRSPLATPWSRTFVPPPLTTADVVLVVIEPAETTRPAVVNGRRNEMKFSAGNLCRHLQILAEMT